MTLPFDNNTNRIIGRLTRRSIQSASMKTILTLVAIALSVGLLTGLVLAELGLQTAEARSYATRQHVIYQQLTEGQAQTIAQDDRVADSMLYKQGQYTLEVEDYLLALSYSALDTKVLETIDIVQGSYPQGLYEAAVDRAYLKRAGPTGGTGSTGFCDLAGRHAGDLHGHRTDGQFQHGNQRSLSPLCLQDLCPGGQPVGPAALESSGPDLWSRRYGRRDIPGCHSHVGR